MGGSANVQSPVQASGKGVSQAPQTQQTSYGQSNYGMPNFGYQQPSYYQPQQATGKGAQGGYGYQQPQNAYYQPQNTYYQPQPQQQIPQQQTFSRPTRQPQVLPQVGTNTYNQYNPIAPGTGGSGTPDYADGGEVVAPGMSLLMMEKK